MMAVNYDFLLGLHVFFFTASKLLFQIKISVGDEFLKPYFKIACQTSSLTYLNEVASLEKECSPLLFYVLWFYYFRSE